jgi:site-specific recombinase XerD
MIIPHPRAQDHSLQGLIDAFLADLEHMNRALHTRRAYASDLARFASFYTGPADGITAEVLRAFFASLTDLQPATRARKQAALASFLTWAYQEELIDATPMARVTRVKLDPPNPRGVDPKQVRAILAAIPRRQRRDHLLFHLIATTGLRIGEALALYVGDLDLTIDDEHLRVLGKGNRPRTILLDDPRVVKELRAYLKLTRYTHGPLFRAEKNGRGGPVRYQTIQARWQGYCEAAGVTCTLHQLRHTHATQLVNAGVGLATIRKRLGHKNLQTTLRYAEQTDATADAEVRAWRRRSSQG